MEVEEGEIRAQVDRLLRSKTFETSEVHRRLLHYLAEKSIAGEAGRLKEYIVGLETFGKPPSYDPKHDSIVRLQVGRLRQKLMAYYETEAAGDPVRVTLPKGAFELKFEPLTALPPAVPARVHPRRMAAVLGTALVAAVVWASFSTVRLVRLEHETAGMTGQWSADLETLWGPVLHSDRPLLICLGAPLFLRFRGFGFFRDPKTNDWQSTATSERVRKERKALGVDPIASYAYTGTGEAGSAFLIAKLLSTRRSALLLTHSNVLSWQQIADNNVVFIGPPKFNPQLQAPALRQDIVIEPEGIRNLKPQPGEPVFLRDQISPERPSEGETAALISHAPGLSGTGDVWVIAGNGSPDTLAAAEWVTEPRRARELVARLRTASGEMPKYYQVVLKVTFKQSIPVESSYVFHHVLSR